MTTKLHIDDYVNLLKLHNGHFPAWTAASLRRTIAAGYVSERTHMLSQVGTEQAKILAVYVKELEDGVPLSKRFVDRTDDLAQDKWIRTEFKGERCFVSAAACFRGGPPDCLWGIPYRPLPDGLKYELQGFISSQTLGKMLPYAVQIDRLGGQEYVCFRPIVKSKNKSCRIQSRYYDYVVSRYGDTVSWWQRYSAKTDPVLYVKFNANNAVGFGEKIVGIIKPCLLNRPFPVE